jgi:3-hydroxyisobutyrate dehydrogenase
VTTAGFIGLGSQGAGMAHRIIDAGIPLTLWARTPSSLEPFRGRATVVGLPSELGARSDVVGICVTDDSAVREVTAGPNGVLAGMNRGSVLAIHSTIGTETCAEVAEVARNYGVTVIDAPVSGGGEAAAAGALTVYVGGSVEDVEQARPVLETYGDPVLHMGALGCGLRTKFINNLLNAAHFGLAHDAVAVGEALGLDPELLGKALTNGSGRSYSLEVFVAMGSLDVIADHVGPLWSKDIGLFGLELLPVESPERGALLTAADRLLALVGHPRSAGSGAMP